MNKYLFFILIMCMHSHQLQGKYNGIKSLTTSVIIPCSYKHAHLLPSLIEAYEDQTKLPDEIIISLSQATQAPRAIIRQLLYKKYQFPVKLLLSADRKFAGENRNNACKNACGDIFICQDADDIPHPQRIEIIKYLFETYTIDHLVHSYCFSHESDFYTIFDLQKITVSFPEDFTYIKKSLKKLHNGNIALSRHVFEKMRWTSRPKGQDFEFNRKVYILNKFNLCAIEAELIMYRNELSSWLKI